MGRRYQRRCRRSGRQAGGALRRDRERLCHRRAPRAHCPPDRGSVTGTAVNNGTFTGGRLNGDRGNGHTSWRRSWQHAATGHGKR